MPLAVVPWNHDLLKPLFAQLVPAIEKADVESLKVKASKLSPVMVQEVEREAPWNPAAKVTMVETGPQCAAELLNACGIGADKAHIVAFVTACGCVLTGRSILASKLDQLAAEQAAALKPKTKEPDAKEEIPKP